MTRCLKDQTLLLLYEGEGTDLERAHLKTCWACAKRHRTLARELEVIGRVLREEPPLRSFYHRPRPFYVRWAPVTSTLAVMLALFLGGIWRRSMAPTPFPEKSHGEEVWQFLGEVSNAVFSPVNDIGEPSSSSDTFTYLREALGEK